MENQNNESARGDDNTNEERTTLDPDAKQEASTDPTAQLQEKLALAEQERDEYKDKFLRASAEMENLRRRTEKERSDLLKYGMESFCKDILPVMDSFDKALPDEDIKVEDPDFRGHLEGMILLKHQLYQVLQKHGLESIESAGSPFDPNVHQAIQKLESSDVNEETVSQEFARGYLLNGRLVRPAMVSVAVPKKGD